MFRIKIAQIKINIIITIIMLELKYIVINFLKITKEFCNIKWKKQTLIFKKVPRINIKIKIKFKIIIA